MQENEKKMEVVEPLKEEIVEEPLNEESEEQNQTDSENNFTSQSMEYQFTDSNVNDGKIQTDEENAKYAQIRRKAEQDARIKAEKEIKEAYEKGKSEAFFGKTNPFTNTEIKDATDFQIYEEMLELVQSGKDPIGDYIQYTTEKRRAAEKESRIKREAEEKAKNDVESFNKKYPDINLSELLNDSNFIDYIDGKKKSLIDMYDSYNRLKNSFRKEAIDVAKTTLANAKANPGSLVNGNDNTIDYNSMSSAEFNKLVQGVIDGDIK